MISHTACSSTVIASIEKEMEELFNASTNITSGGAYKGQSGGYYTGGSLYARVPTRHYQFANFQVPSVKAGCGGIDMFMGSFSFINTDQLINAMRGVMSNAAGYSFSLALQTFVPQVYNTMQKLNDIAREMNNLNMNSCETATQIVGGVWPRSDMASKQLCQSMGTSNGKFKDWAMARQGCGTGGKRDETNARKVEKYQHQLGDDFNIAWEAIKNQGIFSHDKSLAEFFITISGTITSKKKGNGVDGSVVVSHYHSLVNSEALFDTLLFGGPKGGGAAEVYSCNEKDKCLEIVRKSLGRISEKKALVPQVEETLRSIATKMKDHNGKLTDREKSLIELTQIPILKIVSVQNAFTAGNGVINIYEYAEPIAYDYLLGYLERILDFVSVNISQLEKVQIDGTHIDNFKKDITNVRKMITDKRFGAYQRMIAALTVVEKTNLVEKKMQHMFTHYNEIK
ncbi:conjugal transfer protein TraH [Rickettsiales endosymbiont of Peranema trichophorum]|uniref:conjugal transfer protein TraH n=1 Tax=Rickettsiales endosymbiont of Peranema trichophorum TaxID=2486577 RepID=UPI0013EEB6E1|nr:conjugal transfer protein TraH [Rickettsiales endosymbiont of Peranema trichophorum]